MPKLSIIIATYNSEITLRRALESVSTQSFQDWECIIVDGVSKDNTLQIIEEYEDYYLIEIPSVYAKIDQKTISFLLQYQKFLGVELIRTYVILSRIY